MEALKCVVAVLLLDIAAAAVPASDGQHITITTERSHPKVRRQTSTVMPFADVQDFHLSTGVYLVWGGAALFTLFAALVAVLCLEWSKCPLNRRRREKRQDFKYANDEHPVIINVREQPKIGPDQKVAQWMQQSVTSAPDGKIPYERF